MKIISSLNTILLLLLMYACSGNNNMQPAGDSLHADSIIQPIVKDSFATGKIINITCKANTSQSYTLYIPKIDNNMLPVVFFFDPQADGMLPLEKYKALADEFHFILIGSNNSKNGNDWPATENIWSTLYSDVQQRISFNHNRMYVCGFSGGAKVAGYTAIKNNNIKGVIADGAGLPDATPAGNFTFSFTAIAGKGDMNMTELVELNNELNTTTTNHRIISFNGKHEWAPESIMQTAFKGWQLDAMRNGLIKKDDAFINTYTAESKKKINTLSSSNKLLDAVSECTLSADMLNGLSNEIDWFKSKEASIQKDASYKQLMLQQRKLFETEQQTKAIYNQQFQQGDINYWKKTIAALQTQSKPKTEEAAMYQRLLAYLSLAFYSISNQFISNNQNDAALHFVELYKLADSTNSEAWYFSALLNARNNNTAATKADLEKAIRLGYNDKQRLLRQTEFEGMATQINLTDLSAAMK